MTHAPGVRDKSDGTSGVEARFLCTQTEVAQVALSSPQPDVLLPRLLEAIGRTQGYRYGLFWQAGEGDTHAVVRATYGEGTESFLGFRQALDDPALLTASAIQTGQAAFCSRLAERSCHAHLISRALGARAVVVLPVVQRRKGRVVGALTFGDPEDPDRFSEHDLAQGMVLANQVAQAMENAELFSQLKALKQQYQAVTQSLNDVVFTIDTEGRFMFANPAAERLSGYGLQELRGHAFPEIVAPEDVPLLRDRLRRALAGESVPPKVEVTLIRKDGGEVLIELSVSNLVVDGRVTGRVGVARDVTEQRRAEATLAERARLAALSADVGAAFSQGDTLRGVLRRCADALVRHLGAAFTGIWTVDAEGDMPELQASAGIDPQPDRASASVPGDALKVALIAETRRPCLADVVLSDPDGAHWKRPKDRIVAFAGHPLVVEDRLVGVIAMVTPRPLAHGAFDAMGAVAVAIAQGIERKRAEEAHRESEERFRSAFEDASIGMALYASDGRFLRVNRALCGMLGHAEAALLARTVQQITHPDDLPVDLDFTREMLAGVRSSYQREKRYLHKLGQAVWVLASVSLVRGRDGRPAYFIAQVQDITERKWGDTIRNELEEELLQAQKLQSVGRLAGGIAHDFNNLLTVITGRSEQLLAGLRPDDPARRHLEQIRQTADQAAGLTQRLLVFTRKSIVKPQPLDLNRVVSDMEKILRRLLGEHIELETRQGPALKRVMADHGQLEQVILNLAINARDAMPEGGRLSLETANVHLDELRAMAHVGIRPGPYVRLAVGDTGAGMDPRTRARVFEPCLSTKGGGEGAGLGLAIVHSIVSEAGGYIDVDTAPGRGTTFRIYLPAVADAGEIVGPSAIPRALPRGSETILLVEDDPGVRDLARETLEASGYTVLAARNGRDAIRLCRQQRGPINLLLTDVVMPKLGGPALASELVSQRPDLKVLHMSGYTGDRALYHGPNQEAALLEKPFTAESLALKVREVLDAPGRGGPPPTRRDGEGTARPGPGPNERGRRRPPRGSETGAPEPALRGDPPRRPA